jgi:hypothetical protein
MLVKRLLNIVDLSVVLAWEFRSDVSLPVLLSEWAVAVKQFRVRDQNVARWIRYV